MASVMYAGGRAVGVRAYGGKDPVTKKTRNLYLPLPPDATTEDIDMALDRIQRLARFSKEQGKTANISALVSYYVDTLELDGMSPGTIASYRSNIRCYIDPILGDLMLHEADTYAWSSMYYELLDVGGKDGRPLSGETIIKLNSWLKGFYRYMIDLGFTDSNPLLRVRTPKHVKPEVEVLDLADYAKLYRYITERIESGEACVFDFAIFLDMGTGIRGGELAALDVENFFPKNNELLIKKSTAENSKKNGIKKLRKRLINKGTKNDKFRRISIDDDRAAAIDLHLQIQKRKLAKKGIRQGAKTPLFARSDGKRYRPRSFNDYFKKVVKKLDLSPSLHLHCLRHTHLSALLEGDVSLVAAADRAGHYSPSVTTDKYGHVIKDSDPRSAKEFRRFEQEALEAYEQDQEDH